MGESVDGPTPNRAHADDIPTPDDARDVLIEALARLADNRLVTQTGHTVEYVEDAGASRHERLVAFELIGETGPIVEFIATIRISGDE